MTIPSNIKNLITRFSTASQDVAFKGAAHPDDRRSIEDRHKRARDNLEAAIQKALDWKTGT